MKILLVNPPNAGRSIAEEQFGITSIKRIFRGEPLGLEELAGNLPDHEVRIVDLKAEPAGDLTAHVRAFAPDVVGFTAMTCEADAVLGLAADTRNARAAATIVVGGCHASSDPAYFQRPPVDVVVAGLGKRSFREVVEALADGRPPGSVPGVVEVRPGRPQPLTRRRFAAADLAPEQPPRYDLTAAYRPHYTLTVGGTTHAIGFVATAYGCPHDCTFCCLGPLTGRRYLTCPPDTVVRNLQRLGDVPLVRLVDANSFAHVGHARALADSLTRHGLRHRYIADLRADVVVRHPDLLRRWAEAGLASAVIGFESTRNETLAAWHKDADATTYRDAIATLHRLGIRVIGDFIITPAADERDFDQLSAYIREQEIDLPMITVLTPLPGTALHRQLRRSICVHDLAYYTLTNAVTPLALPADVFYARYAGLLAEGHARARL